MDEEGLILKVHFAKTSDHVDWSFLNFVWKRMGLEGDGGNGFMGACLLVISQS